MCFRTGRDNLRGVADGLEEILKRPAAGQVNSELVEVKNLHDDSGRHGLRVAISVWRIKDLRSPVSDVCFRDC